MRILSLLGLVITLREGRSYYEPREGIFSLSRRFADNNGEQRRTRAEARLPTSTNDIYLFCRNVFGFLSYVPTISLRYYFLISSNCVSLYISIYISILYTNISIYSYYISSRTLRTLIHTLFSLRSCSFASYLYIYTHWAAQNDMEIYTCTHIHTHARITFVDELHFHRSFIGNAIAIDGNNRNSQA